MENKAKRHRGRNLATSSPDGDASVVSVDGDAAVAERAGGGSPAVRASAAGHGAVVCFSCDLMSINKNTHPKGRTRTRREQNVNGIPLVVRVRPPIAKQRKSALSTSKALHARLKKIIGIKRRECNPCRGGGEGGGGGSGLSGPATWKALAPRMSAGRCLVSGCGWARSRASVRD